MRLKDLSTLLEAVARKKTYALVAVLAAVLAGGAVYVLKESSSVKKMIALKKENLDRFRELEQEYLTKRTVLDSVAKKAYAADGGESAVSVVEGMGRRMGIRARITSLRPLEERQALGYTERGVEVSAEKLDLNQLVNFLYLIENNRRLLVIKEFSMKSRFEDPDLYDVTIRLAHLRKAS